MLIYIFFFFIGLLIWQLIHTVVLLNYNQISQMLIAIWQMRSRKKDKWSRLRIVIIQLFASVPHMPIPLIIWYLYIYIYICFIFIYRYFLFIYIYFFSLNNKIRYEIKNNVLFLFYFINIFYYSICFILGQHKT